jgi:lysozyme family protein
MSTTVAPLNTFESSDAFVLGFDGFKDDRAPTENFATAYGVTQMTWAYAITQGVVADKPIAQATATDCAAIRRALYWNALHCSALQPGVNLMVYNDGVLCGAGHSARLLQRIAAVTQDGVIGADTLRRANSMAAQTLIDALAQADEQFFASLAKADLFLAGWTRREEAARALAYKMARINAPVPVPHFDDDPAAVSDTGSADALMAAEQAKLNPMS